MNLIEIYVQEVTRRLPEKSRADIALELQSTIEDMLPDDYTEKDVKLALEKLGDPVTLANQYRDKPPFLIGPDFYDLYIATLKMVLPIAITVVLFIFFVSEFIHFSNMSAVGPFILNLIGEGIWTALDIIIQVFFWVTFVYIILERSGVSPAHMRASGEKWKPEDLKNIPFIPKKKAISKGEVFSSLLWTAIWATVYFNAMHFIGVYRGQDGKALELVTPVFNQEVLLSYWPLMVILISLEISLAIFKWVKGQWTNKLALFNAAYQLLYAIIFIIILVNPHLFASSFITYMIELFDTYLTSVENVKNWIVGLSVATIVITAAIASIEGFRKAKIKSKS